MVKLGARDFKVGLRISKSRLGGSCLTDQVGIEWHTSRLPSRLVQVRAQFLPNASLALCRKCPSDAGRFVVEADHVLLVGHDGPARDANEGALHERQRECG